MMADNQFVIYDRNDNHNNRNINYCHNINMENNLHNTNKMAESANMQIAPLIVNE